jgi:pyruvate dehydrogenase E2 component (dihydrolipoamide acetyltransferase)
MAEVIRMPLLSDTMKEGIIADWLKNVGDTVKSDDVLAEVETDKATMEVMGYVNGTLLYIGVPKGKAAKVNGIICIIGKPGENIQDIINAESQTTETPEITQTATTAQAAVQSTPEAAPAQSTQAQAPQPPAPSNDRLKASPLAKTIAQQKGINLQTIIGSGDDGRIVKKDIENHNPSTAPQASTQAASTAIQTNQESYTEVPLTQMRKVIAERLSQSKYTAPHFYLTIEVDMDNCIAARQQLNELSPVKISYNDIIIKASAMALRQHPFVNSSWGANSIKLNHHIHIGSAVAIEEGLIVPVIKFADTLSLSQIATTANQLYEKARTKKLQPTEFTGNTFTISNLGMMDIDNFTAIINPPDVAILAVGKIKQQPVVKNNNIVIGNTLTLTLSCDHRAVDGAVGSRFLQTLKAFIQNPVTLLV